MGPKIIGCVLFFSLICFAVGCGGGALVSSSPRRPHAKPKSKPKPHTISHARNVPCCRPRIFGRA